MRVLRTDQEAFGCNRLIQLDQGEIEAFVSVAGVGYPGDYRAGYEECPSRIVPSN